jgi:hypothetical protein
MHILRIPAYIADYLCLKFIYAGCTTCTQDTPFKDRLLFGANHLAFKSTAYIAVSLLTLLATESVKAQKPVDTNALSCGESASMAVRSGVTVQRVSDAQPGDVDPLGMPAGRYHLFPDDGILAISPSAAGFLPESFVTDTNLNMPLADPTWTSPFPWDPNGWGPTPMFVTSGRIVNSDRDNVAFAYREGAPTDANARIRLSFLEDQGRRQSILLPGHLLPRVQDSTDFVAMTHADLDREPGLDGNLHDEIVVARVSAGDQGSYAYQLDVLNFGNGKMDAPEISSSSYGEIKPTFNQNPTASIGSTLPSDNIISVVAGDFEGTGEKEVAVISQGQYTILIYTFRYEKSGNGHVLRLVSGAYFPSDLGKVAPWSDRPLVGTIAATTGDFDGDGKDELAIAYAKWGSSPEKPSYGGYGVGTLLLKYGADLKPTITSDTVASVGGIADKSFPYGTRPRVEITSAQFLLNSTNALLGRHQIVTAWKDSGSLPGAASAGPYIGLRAYTASNDLTRLDQIGTTTQLTDSANGGVQVFAMASGGFTGTSGTLPTSQLAISRWTGRFLNTAGRFIINTLKVDGNGISGASAWSENTIKAIDYRVRVPIVAYDKPGNSRYLGAPVHITVLGQPKTSFIMQEPPKHMYWDEKAHEVRNITRYDGNNVALFKGDTAAMSTMSTDTSSRNTGGAIEISAGATVKTGASLGILKGEQQTSVDVLAKGSYDYNEHKEEYNGGYRSTRSESTGQTDRDDYVIGNIQTTDIWRYRVFGTPKDSNRYAYYEVVLPGPREGFANGALNFDWYQPIHENGNILSYPAKLGSGTDRYLPSDLGQYTLPNKSVLKKPQIPGELNYFDGNTSSKTLKYNNEVSDGKSFTYTNSISESLDIRASWAGEVTSPFVSGSARACGSFEVHNTNSWGGNETSSNTTTDETAITLNRAKGVSTQAYPFYPVLYNTKDGTMKMTYAVPNPGDTRLNSLGASTYNEIYGRLPDPALNLPLRFVPRSAGSGELEQWEANQSTTRKRMRGLFFRKPTVDAASGTYPYQTFNPVDGDIVRIEPRVYNYSTQKTASNIKVHFQAIPYDSSTNSEICTSPINADPGRDVGLVCPRSARTTIGETTIQALAPLQFTCVTGMDDPDSTGCSRESAFINWDTRSFGPTVGTVEYRIYVVLNPNAAANSETYGLEPAPVSITNIAYEDNAVVVTAPGNKFSTGDYAIIGAVRGLEGINGTFKVTYLDNDRFSLNETSKKRGSYVPGTGEVSILDPGQNNEGYGIIGVAQKAPSVSAESTDLTPHDYLDQDAFAGMSEGSGPRIMEGGMSAFLGVPMELRFKAYSNVVHGEPARVLLYDGDPASGAKIVADHVIHPGENGENGTSIWFNWTPAIPGEHTLYAVLYEGTGNTQAAGVLNVSVIQK